MLRNLIIIENGQEYQFDTLEDIVKNLIDENYYNMTKEGKTNAMKMKALANCINNKMEVVQENTGNIENKFIIKDEITYILSLLKTNNIILLENKDSNYLTKDIDKSNMEDNYIIVNTFAKDLLNNYLNEK